MPTKKPKSKKPPTQVSKPAAKDLDREQLEVLRQKLERKYR
jgi:hypothetical protein